ncbi:MAG: DUF6062 family protein, partial [Oscillospiraceae bacterium]|nr:DUF6062 family protein [Oscillospiraceae bacterium]
RGMPEKIFTIPINEAMDRYDGCPLCHLRARLEEDNLKYALGAAMMEPDVRIEMNRLGFCAKHFDDMFAAKNKLALALILESHLDEVSALFPQPGEDTGRKKRKPPKGPDEADRVSELAGSCFICSRIRGTVRRYYSNFVYLWDSDPAFREKLARQPFICVTDASGILKAAKAELKPASYAGLTDALNVLVGDYVSSVRADVTKYCQSFDYRNADKPLGEEKNSVEKAIRFLR